MKSGWLREPNKTSNSDHLWEPAMTYVFVIYVMEDGFPVFAGAWENYGEALDWRDNSEKLIVQVPFTPKADNRDHQ